MSISRPALETAQSHRSIRKFKNESIAPELLNEILTAGQMVSTSSFLQSVSIIRVTDKEKRAKIRQICAGNVPNGHHYVENCAEFLVFCIDAHRHHQLVADAQTDWIEALLTGAVDTALFAQNVFLVAESMGLGGVYIGGIRNDIHQMAEILATPNHVIPLVGMCLGYPDHQPDQRPRLPLRLIVSENTYQAASEQDLAQYNETVHAYYQTRKLDLNWQQQIQSTLGNALRPELLEFLQSKGFAKR